MESNNKYNNGKIYKLVLKQGIEPKEDYNQFLGYTTLPLNIKLYGYENDYKRYLKNKFYYCKIFKLFDDYGIDNIDIILIKNIDCNNKKELKEKYYNYIDNLNNIY